MLLNERYIGLMSGTSVDGVDAVIADLADNAVKTLGHVHVPFTPALRAQLQALMASGVDEIERAGDASVALARAYADAAEALLKATGLRAADVAAIGAHGQTIRHRPERGFTLQINQPALLAVEGHDTKGHLVFTASFITQAFNKIVNQGLCFNTIGARAAPIIDTFDVVQRYGCIVCNWGWEGHQFAAVITTV